MKDVTLIKAESLSGSGLLFPVRPSFSQEQLNNSSVCLQLPAETTEAAEKAGQPGAAAVPPAGDAAAGGADAR